MACLHNLDKEFIEPVSILGKLGNFFKNGEILVLTGVNVKEIF